MKVVILIDHENDMLIGYHVSDKLFDKITELEIKHVERNPIVILQLAEQACDEQAKHVYTHRGDIIVD